MSTSDPQSQRSPEPPADLNPFEAAERQRKILLRVVRTAFVVVLGAATVQSIVEVGAEGATSVIQLSLYWSLKVAIALSLAIIIISVDLLTPRKKISTLSTIFLGLLAGIVATVAFGFLIDLVVQTHDFGMEKGSEKSWIFLIKILMGICLSYLGISIVLQTQDDFRLVIPYVEFVKQIRGPRPLLLDTSALIDGRIAEIGSTGLVQSPVVIPRFVIAELQLLADNSDKLKRSRGRRGLEIVGRLQRSTRLDVSIEPANVAGQGVDQMITELARQMQGMVVTTDSGLARVAAINGVQVLNLNDLSSAVRPAALPGDQINVRVIRPGEQPGQGVAYLEDGTMVVVEDGGQSLDQSVTVGIISTVQTSGGRLLFARLVRHDAAGAATDTSNPAPLSNGAPALPSASAVDSQRTLEGSSAPIPAPVSEPTSADPAPHDPAHAGPYPPNPPRHGNRLRNPRR